MRRGSLANGTHGETGRVPTGFPMQSPYVAIANRQAEIMMRIASEFGFTPASRSRISTPSAAEPSLLDLIETQKQNAAGPTDGPSQP